MNALSGLSKLRPDLQNQWVHRKTEYPVSGYGYSTSLSASSFMWKWYVCGILFLATLLNYMDRQVLALSLPDLKKNFFIDEGRNG